MRTRSVELQPQLYARVGGIIYLITIAAGLFADIFVEEKLVVYSDAAATATNILGHESLFRFGIAADLTTYLCAIAETMILYVLLRPVDKNLSLLAVFFNLVQDAIGCINDLDQMKVIQLLKGGNYLRAFSSDQLHGMALALLKSHAAGFAIALLFFAFYLLIVGDLIFKAGYFPRILGVLVTIAGISYLINSVAVILSPPLEQILFPTILIPAFIGELSLALWLTFKGVNVSKWNEATAS